MAEPKGGWPCDRRDAHHPHPPAWSDAIDTPDCPGVAAHPNTMIGRAG